MRNSESGWSSGLGLLFVLVVVLSSDGSSVRGPRISRRQLRGGRPHPPRRNRASATGVGRARGRSGSGAISIVPSGSRLRRAARGSARIPARAPRRRRGVQARVDVSGRRARRQLHARRATVWPPAAGAALAASGLRAADRPRKRDPDPSPADGAALFAAPWPRTRRDRPFAPADGERDISPKSARTVHGGRAPVALRPRRPIRRRLVSRPPSTGGVRAWGAIPPAPRWASPASAAIRAGGVCAPAPPPGRRRPFELPRVISEVEDVGEDAAAAGCWREVAGLVGAGRRAPTLPAVKSLPPCRMTSSRSRLSLTRNSTTGAAAAGRQPDCDVTDDPQLLCEPAPPPSSPPLPLAGAVVAGPKSSPPLRLRSPSRG